MEKESTNLPLPQQPTPTIKSQHFSENSRMQNDLCFYCNKRGHWARFCPNKTPEKSSPSSSRGGPNRSSEYPSIDCPCGNGICRIFVSKTDENPGRSFYRCPVLGSGDCLFFKWCDEIKKEDTIVPPECPCGAGRCKKLIEVKEPNVGRSYFVCPIKKGFGACPFFEWADSQSSTEVNFCVDKSKGYGSPQSMCDSDKVFDVLNNDLQTKPGERMEVTVSNTNDSPNSEAVPTSSGQTNVLLKESHDSGRTSRILPENEHPSLCLTSQKENTVPNSTDRGTVMQEVESWNSIVQKDSVDHLLSQSTIHCRQMEFWRQISAAGGISTTNIIYQGLGLQVLGWLGRLAFFSPPRCLKDHTPRPFFCGAFPPYDHIYIPKDNVLNPEGPTFLADQCLFNNHNDNLSSPFSGQDLQLWNGDIQKPSSLKRSAITMEDDNVRSFVASLISKSLEKMVQHIQNQLVIMILNSIDSSNHDCMTKAAHTFLPLLDRMPVDNDAFSGHVKDFIDSAKRLSAIEQANCNEKSMQECSELYNCEKVHFDDISTVHEKAVSEFTSCSTRLQSLKEEASHVRDMLRQIEDKLLCCEAETSKLETHLDRINRDMLESKSRMQKAEEALKLCKQREEERCAAKAALEKAGIQLQKYVGV
ncbi:uncharacterized protein LOC123195714 isoform X3 [Mangifera indica]|uniref:uncharacterized protein LOC123195714 isoform X3 n=1 Tax=Mangifera indica TaxID=29780 RepID=UPI001CFAE926|nr:uncharacterized protein LOC123195714 isoform X3 [Mangifera indica]